MNGYNVIDYSGTTYPTRDWTQPLPYPGNGYIPIWMDPYYAPPLYQTPVYTVPIFVGNPPICWECSQPQYGLILYHTPEQCRKGPEQRMLQAARELLESRGYRITPPGEPLP